MNDLFKRKKTLFAHIHTHTHKPKEALSMLQARKYSRIINANEEKDILMIDERNKET